MNLLKRISNILLLVIISIAFSFMFLEILLRFIGDKKNLEVGWILQSDKRDWSKDPDLIFITEDIFDKLEKLSSFDENTNIILLIGDSYTRGEPNPKQWSYDRKLKTLLEEASGNSVEIVNLGVSGYGPDQEIVLLKKALERNKNIKAVVWQFYSNDVIDNYMKSLFSLKENKLVQIDGFNHWIYKRHEFYDQIPVDRKLKMSSFVLNRILYFFERNKFYQIPDNFDKYSQFSLKKISLEIDEVKEMSKNIGFDLYLPLVAPQAFSSKEVIKINGHEISDFIALKELLRKHPEFIDIEILEGSSSGYNVVNDFFASETQDSLPFGFRHFNERGYEKMAKIIFENITSTASAKSQQN